MGELAGSRNGRGRVGGNQATTVRSRASGDCSRVSDRPIFWATWHHRHFRRCL